MRRLRDRPEPHYRGERCTSHLNSHTPVYCLCANTLSTQSVTLSTFTPSHTSQQSLVRLIRTDFEKSKSTIRTARL